VPSYEITQSGMITRPIHYTEGGKRHSYTSHKMIPPVSLIGALEEARRLFAIYDNDKSGYLERHEIPRLLTDTYRGMGVNYVLTQHDVDSYIRFADVNRDGKISKQEFEEVVIKSLQARGIKV